MQQRVETKKVTTLHKNMTSLTRLWLQTLTQYQQNLMRIKQLVSTLGHIVDVVRLDLEFVEDSLKTRGLQRVVRLLCVWILEGYKFVRTFIATRSIITRNRVGQLQVHTNSTYFSVIFWKWSVEVCPERGRCLMRSQ